MTNMKYTHSFIRKTGTGKEATYRGVLKYKDEDGKWRQVSCKLDVARGTTSRQTDLNAQRALDAWHEEMEEAAAREERAKMDAFLYISNFVENKTNSRNGKPLEQGTMDNYRRALRHLDAPEMHKALYEVTPADVSKVFAAAKAGGAGKVPLSKAFRLLRMAFASARRLGLVDANPTDDMTVDEGKPVVPAAEVSGLDAHGVSVVNALLDEYEGQSRFADAVRFALLTGMRVGEVCGLRFCDVEGWRAGKPECLHVVNVISRSSAGEHDKRLPKNGEAREIAVNAPMAEIINRRAAAMRADCKEAGVILRGDEYVFGRLSAGRPGGFYSPSYLSHQWSDFAKRHNIVTLNGKHCVFHSLRHSYAIVMLNAGVPVIHVAQVLGHKDASVTERIYAAFIPKGTKQTQDVAADLMGSRASLTKVLKSA